ncbi:hypothetical protein [Haloarchaeobius iranensis]|uniref:Uncharacterized protein n=1 Tax=Haloarchaeobius iranensis TaxID=996166 RepID=A0A1G9SX33_9EURY|nr:hypothetical protein [Haloarchaeobius iranensis]SDM40018.1 hypothetical protein SAMN05192554_10214 [Haloarchaeobius iranensis]
MSLHTDERPWLTAAATVAFLVGVVALTEATPRSVLPIAVLFGGTALWNVVEAAVDTPKGSNWVVFGGLVACVGGLLALVDGSVLLGAAVVAAGLWFVADGATTVLYAPATERPAFLSGIDEDSGEAMRRMGTLRTVYQRLEAADSPVTPAELAADLELTEQRAADALSYLETQNRVEKEDAGYRVQPPRWGRFDPVVRFLVWVPRRLLRPVSRVRRGRAD